MLKLAQYQATIAAIRGNVPVPAVTGGGAAGAGGGAGVAGRRQQSALVQTMQRVGLSTQQAERAAAAMARSWATIAGFAERVSRVVTDMVRQLTSFTGMMGLATGAATLGGMFGLDAIGRMASGLRMQSLALSPGADVGRMQAFNIMNRRLGVGPQTLQAVSNMMQSPVGRGLLTGLLGANVREEMDPADATMEALRALRERAQGFRAQGMPLASIMQATQAGQLGVTPEALMRLMNMPQQEFARQQQLMQSRAGQLQIGDRDLRNWQDFLDTIDTAKGSIEKTFIEGLAPLAEPIGRLAESVRDMLQAMLEGPRIRGWIEEFRAAVEHATEWLKDPSHKTAIDTFFAQIGNVVEHLAHFAAALSGLVDWIAAHFRGIVIAGAALEGAKYGAMIGGGLGSIIPGVGTAAGAGAGALIAGVAAGYGAYRLTAPGEGGTAAPFVAQPSAWYRDRYEELYRIATLRNLPHPDVFAAVGAAQSVLETGGGASVPGHNLFGIKARGGEPSVMASTHEMVGGQMVPTQGRFAAEAGAPEYLDLLRRQSPTALAAGSTDEAINAIAPWYATDMDYAAKVRAIVRANSGAPQAPAPAPPPPRVAAPLPPGATPAGAKLQELLNRWGGGTDEEPGAQVNQQVSALGRAWRDQSRQLAMGATARPVSSLGTRLPTDGSAAARLNNVLITLRTEAGGNAFISAGAMAT